MSWPRFAADGHGGRSPRICALLQEGLLCLLTVSAGLSAVWCQGCTVCTLLQVAFEGQMTELRQLLEADAKLRQLRRQVAQQIPGSTLRRSMSSLARHRVTWTPDMVRSSLIQSVMTSGCMLPSWTAPFNPVPAPDWGAFLSGHVTWWPW